MSIDVESAEEKPDRVASAWKHAAYCIPQLALMFGLTMPIAMLGALADDPELNLDTAAVNAALAAGSMARALGKLVNGVSVDIFGVQRFLAVVMGVATCAACVFGMAHSQASLVLAFCMLQYSSSGSWPAGCKIIERGFRKDEWAPCFSALATCSRLGSMVARLFLGALLVKFTWRQIAFVCSGALLFCWVLSANVLLAGADGQQDSPEKLRKSPDASSKPPPSPSQPQHLQLEDIEEEAEVLPRAVRIRRMLCNRGLQLQACIVSAATCIMALENMCPMLLKDVTELGHAEIGMYAALFPTAVLCGVLICPQVYARIKSPHARLRFEVGLQLVSLCGVIGLGWLCQRPAHSMKAGFFLLGLVGVAVGIAFNYYIKPGMHTLEFGEDCATASSFLDGCGQLAAVSFQAAASVIFEWGGSWVHVCVMLAFCLLVMMICTVLLFFERNEIPRSTCSWWTFGPKTRIGVPMVLVTCMLLLRLSSTTNGYATFSAEELLRRHEAASPP